MSKQPSRRRSRRATVRPRLRPVLHAKVSETAQPLDPAALDAAVASLLLDLARDQIDQGEPEERRRRWAEG